MGGRVRSGGYGPGAAERAARADQPAIRQRPGAGGGDGPALFEIFPGRSGPDRPSDARRALSPGRETRRRGRTLFADYRGQPDSGSSRLVARPVKPPSPASNARHVFRCRKDVPISGRSGRGAGSEARRRTAARRALFPSRRLCPGRGAHEDGCGCQRTECPTPPVTGCCSR